MNPKAIVEVAAEVGPAGLAELETLAARVFGAAGMREIKTLLVDAATKTTEDSAALLHPISLGTTAELADGSFARAMENLSTMTEREAGLSRMSRSVASSNVEGLDLARFQRVQRAAQLKGTELLERKF